MKNEYIVLAGEPKYLPSFVWCYFVDIRAERQAQSPRSGVRSTGCDQLQTDRPPTPRAKRLGVDCSALLGLYLYVAARFRYTDGRCNAINVS